MKNEELFSIFKSVKENHKNSDSLQENVNSKILIVDFLNTFIRSFAASPATDNHGNHIGGISAFIYSIGSAIKRFNPTRCIIVSDGKNSGARKRKILSSYKEGRKMSKNLNRYYDFGEDQETEMQREIFQLIEYLQLMPLNFIMADSTEADDTISYIATELYDKDDNNIIIMSSDKDFLQLVDDRITVWSPIKKKHYTVDTVLNEYGIHPNNFLFYRILDGDPSDNLPGVKGIGKKTLLKNMPFFGEERPISIDEILSFSREKVVYKKSPPKFFEKILDNKDVMELNESLMQLYNPNISETNKSKIRNLLNNDIPTLQKINIIVKYKREGLSSAIPDIEGWMDKTLTRLNIFARRNNGEI